MLAKKRKLPNQQFASLKGGNCGLWNWLDMMDFCVLPIPILFLMRSISACHFGGCPHALSSSPETDSFLANIIPPNLTC
jgi:hypothetical protein